MGVEVSLHIFLTLTLYGVKPANLSPGIQFPCAADFIYKSLRAQFSERRYYEVRTCLRIDLYNLLSRFIVYFPLFGEEGRLVT